MGKTILIICDGLRNDTAAQQMGFMEHLVETRRGTRFTARTTLPTVSKTSYETLHTGLDAIDHGITGNFVTRPSSSPNLFKLASQYGLSTAASAYYWFFELYVGLTYDPTLNSEHDNLDTPIQRGIFYKADSMPDDEVFARGANLASVKQPDYLLIHVMGLDHASHMSGSDSAHYRNQAIHQDQLLAQFVPDWTEMGYTVILTSDHGHTTDKQHGGTGEEVRNVPLYIVPSDGNGLGETGETVSHLSVAPTICQIMKLPIPATMAAPVLKFSMTSAASGNSYSVGPNSVAPIGMFPDSFSGVAVPADGSVRSQCSLSDLGDLNTRSISTN
ncbi:MAG: alkaline phosphatase family protein [Chloroflexi bacterium]|nr:alkaline phosphatase family protein [Chloroflexota bacterium]MDA1283039.1 alkaline phosphatase family protein [Chloroflexota bacterium]